MACSTLTEEQKVFIRAWLVVAGAGTTFHGGGDNWVSMRTPVPAEWADQLLEDMKKRWPGIWIPKPEDSTLTTEDLSRMKASAFGAAADLWETKAARAAGEKT